MTVTASSPDGSVSVASGPVTVQGSLSVQDIPAGMGVAPAGTVVPVYGTGFTAATAVSIDGVAIQSAEFVSSQEIDLTLGGAAELVGKRARVTDGGTEFDYFCFQPNAPVNSPGSTYPESLVANVQPLFPLQAATGLSGYTSEFGGVIEVQNPNGAAAAVSVTNTPACCGPPTSGTPATLSIPAGSWALFAGGDDSDFVVSASLPVRVLALEDCGMGTPPQVCLGTVLPYDAATLGPAAPVLAPASLAFSWQVARPRRRHARCWRCRRKRKWRR